MSAKNRNSFSVFISYHTAEMEMQTAKKDGISIEDCERNIDKIIKYQ
jgi:hypothetical protein